MARPGYDDVVLVTGFPSFYARKMVEQILSTEPRALLYLVILQQFQVEAVAALDALPEGQRERVVVFEGDAAAMDLGLSGAEFRQVTREIDRVHHVAHASDLGVDRRSAETLNVRGTAEIVELCRAAEALRCLVHHSTAQVAGDRTGVVYEDDLERGQSFGNVVEETRYRAEQVARRARREVPIAIVRPTALVGDSATGETDRLDGPYLLVLLMLVAPTEIAIPLPGAGDHPLHVVPIDYVVRAAQHIGRSDAAAGLTFHLADPRPLPARRAFEEVARATGRRAPRGSVPPSLAKALLRAPGFERLARSPRALVDQLSRPVRFDTRNADRLLAGSGIECPPFGSYVDQLVGHAQAAVRAGRRDSLEALDLGDDPLP
jgi:thioester reductase-like protein